MENVFAMGSTNLFQIIYMYLIESYVEIIFEILY